MYSNFHANWTALTFSTQIYPKMDLGLEIQKTNVGTRISTSKILVCQISVKTDNFEFFWPKFGEIAQLRAIFLFQ